MTDSIVEISGLRKEYGDFTAVHDSNFEIDEGEVFGIVGPNGAGKTSTLKMVSGLIRPTAGAAIVSGYNSTDSEMRKTLGFLPEESPLYEDMTGVSYLEFFADLYDVPKDTAERRIHETLDELDLEHRDRKIGDMSKGMTRKVAIARSLVNDPDVLVYDEPASGLDPLTTNYIIEFIKELRDDGKTILFSAHDLHQVEELCDRVAIMADGEIVARGTLQDIQDEYGYIEYNVFTTQPTDNSTQVDDNLYKTTFETMDAVNELSDAVESNGGEVTDIRTNEPDLEEIFLSLTKQ